MILNLDLMDMWRELNAECKRFTWLKPIPLQQRCLDFILISEYMVPYVEQTDIQYGYRSDHSMIVLKLKITKRKKKTKNILEIE